MDTVEGYNPVVEAMRSGRAKRIFVLKGHAKAREIADLARQEKVTLEVVDGRWLDRHSRTGEHQGILAFAEPLDYCTLGDILALAEVRKEPPFIVILDGIEDPHNLGAILRSCDGAGVHGVIIPKKGSAGFSPGAGKASAGAMEHVIVAQAGIIQTMEVLRGKGVWLVCADSQAKKDYFEEDLKGPVAFVIGGEDRGLSPQVRERCDLAVRIPMRGKLKCLNASVAAALLVYEKRRQEG